MYPTRLTASTSGITPSVKRVDLTTLPTAPMPIMPNMAPAAQNNSQTARARPPASASLTVLRQAARNTAG